MSIKTIEVETIARICFVAVTVQRQSLKEALAEPEPELECHCKDDCQCEGECQCECTCDEPAPQPTWEGLDADERGKITDYIVATMTGRPTPDTPDGRMISRVCHQFMDPKKTLRYA